MRVLLFFVFVLVVLASYVAADAADQASRLGPEERRTLLDDDIFEEDSKSRNGNVNSRQRDCARDYEDCRHKSCCNECTRCACKRGGRDCRCNERNELALFLGLCRNR